MRFFFLIAALLAFASLPAMAAHREPTPRLLGSFGYWRTYRVMEHDQPVCYMTLTAHFPKYKKYHRGDATLTITHRPGENSQDVFSYTAGYNYKPMSDAELRIGSHAYPLFTSQDTAWSRDAATDHKIAAALRASPQLGITGSPTIKGIAKLIDQFPLKGADDAYRTISKACGLEIPEKSAAKTRPKVKKPAKTSRKL